MLLRHFGHKVGLETVGPMSDIDLRIRLAQSLAEIPAAAWDACAANSCQGFGDQVKVTLEGSPSPDLSTRGQPSIRFITHGFLSSLEASNSVGGRSGWAPRHLIAEDRSEERRVGK